MKPVHFALLCACLFAFTPALAGAQTDAGKIAAARQIGFDGIKDYQAGNFAAASDKLERAYALVQAPTIGLWSARALSKIGRLVLASERYLETTRLSVPDTNRENHLQAQADAAKERAALLPRIPSLQVDVAGVPASEISLTMDGVAIDSALIGVARPVDPGKRRVVAKYADQEQAKEIELAEGAKETVSFTFEATDAPVVAPAPAPAKPEPVGPAPPPAGPDRVGDGRSNTLAYVALAVGGAGLVVGGITGVMALGKKSELDDSPYCRDDRCGPEAHDDVDSLNTLRTLSTVGFAVGIVGVGVGVTLLATGGSSETAARTELRIGPGQVGVRGTF